MGVVWTLWLTYGAFYFCRTNLSAALPGMKASVGTGGLGLDPEHAGWILAAGKIAYGLGQLLNGQLAERYSPRYLLALGMFASAALNATSSTKTSTKRASPSFADRRIIRSTRARYAAREPRCSGGTTWAPR